MEKIKHIALIEPVGGHGGMDYYDYGLAYGLGANNVSIDYHTCSKTRKRTFSNVTTYYTFKDLWSYAKWKKFYLFLKYYRNAIRQSKKAKCDLVHFHFFSFSIPNLIVLWLCSANKMKSIVTVHDVDSFHGKTIPLVEKLSYRLIDGIIVHNHSSYSALNAKKLKLPKTAIIPHGNYTPFVKQLPLPVSKEPVELLFFGQIKEVKGLDILLKAFAKAIKQNKNFKLTIAGRPWKTELQKYKQLIEELNIADFVETHFRYIPDEEVEQFYAKAHIVVLPYRRIYQSGVLLLTMSYGRTAITSNLPAFTEIVVNNKNGLIFESESVESLAHTILNLTCEKITQTTSQAMETIKYKFDWVNIGKQTKDFYENL